MGSGLSGGLTPFFNPIFYIDMARFMRILMFGAYLKGGGHEEILVHNLYIIACPHCGKSTGIKIPRNRHRTGTETRTSG
jgi:hypothetical protein